MRHLKLVQLQHDHSPVLFTATTHPPSKVAGSFRKGTSGEGEDFWSRSFTWEFYLWAGWFCGVSRLRAIAQQLFGGFSPSISYS
ncbi:MULTISPECIES: hypothetical protein [Trichocoleus]|uniref:Uncharacterized protein n=1 Tax=Trichocoleus desertorum GB2-A4 TaxID=2933944 RepID=A0ABV0J8J5_9CYAN|nr:hypothetical protein [Trichocoleus sp. FACHB-46]MBD1861117.1 hypothetical protein [Trichocoleus sp. FACHB-46]